MNMKLDTVSPAAAGSNAVPVAALPGAAHQPGSVPSPAQAPAAHADNPKQAPPGAAAAMQAARAINEFLKSSSANVEFMVDGRSSKVIVRVVDSETGQVIRQMPSEEMLAISQALDRMTGLLLEQKA